MVLAGQLAQKFALVHAVLEGFAPVDEHNRHFVIELPPQFAVTIHIHFLPSEAAAAREFRQTLLHHLAKMATFARVNHDLAGLRHAAIVPSAHPLLARNKETENTTLLVRPSSEVKPFRSKIRK